MIKCSQTGGYPPTVLLHGIIRLCGLSQFVEKVCIYKNRANSLSLSPLGHSDSFASCKAWCVLISASLPKTPNPFPSVNGCVCLVGFASCKALVHTRPASVPGLSVGLPPSPSKDACSQSHIVAMQGCIKTATQSRCTMQRHKWLSMHRCSDTND